VPGPSRRRALGQHFLRDTGIARAIVEIVAPTPSDVVVEIGPGEGALTGELARRAGRVIALEIDGELARRLRDRWPAIDVVEGDARAWDYRTVPRPSGGRVLVVGNLPYSVSKPIVMALVEARRAIDEMALMLQREVADRLAAAPGSKIYGSLTVMTQLACDVRIALRVSPGAFRPPPKVESSVVHVRPLPELRVPIADEARFRAVVRSAFAQRRKTLGNALAGGLGLPVELVRCASEEVGIDPGRRAETLTIVEFARLAARLS
jgi:16S rRNA (adenine1518-N6/adenine1519-N6)-dimethyltransferase